MVVDLETTGLDLRRDEIVSYGAVVVRQGRILARTSVYGLVRPEGTMTASAVAVHGLRPADLRHAPPLADCVRVLAGLLEGHVLVAHAAWVESAFLGRAFRDHGMRLDGPVIDTAALAREAQVVPDGAEAEPALEELARALHLPVHETHHALGDALTTAGVMLALVTRLERREPQTIASLTRLSRRRGLRR